MNLYTIIGAMERADGQFDVNWIPLSDYKVNLTSAFSNTFKV